MHAPGTRYGLPYILEDRTGTLSSGSEFVDIHDRLHLTIRCTAPRSFMLYNGPPPTGLACPTLPHPLAAMQFVGGRNSGLELGTISFQGVPLPMRMYLVKPPGPAVEGRNTRLVRRFVASDGQQYQWSRKVQPNQEWTCTNHRDYIIASYSLKTPGEPEYPDSSGCILEIAEQFGALAPEILASLWIMRHIADHDM
ncbi:hypothetical protein HMN09_00251000 [Mycena chlorophos]|uniref:Uncharacterized protein n=1 Tax=Mycena chlorophos TaxID=658473 RepID=A0A8H6TKX6_MYCCL|nr:hypothetical protein HMN09_00251000 [Mycena chlorophos]